VLNVVSNVKVYVCNVFSQEPTVIIRNGSKRRRTGRQLQNSINNSSTCKQEHLVPAVTIATITDDSKGFMSLVDTTGKFHTILLQAANEHRQQRYQQERRHQPRHQDNKEVTNMTTMLFVTNVLTKPQRSLYGIKFSSPIDEIVLVTTTNSAAVLVPINGSNNNSDASCDAAVTLSLETQSRQSLSTTYTPKVPHENEDRDEITLISMIRDIMIDDKSIRRNDQSIFSSTASYLETILQKTDDGFGSFITEYSRKVRIRLDRSSINSFIKKRVMPSEILPASPYVLKILCGGLDATELVNDNNGGSSAIVKHSMDFLRGLIEEPVVLEWTVQRRQCYHKNDDSGLLLTGAALNSLP
jgi:hypothetical protein